METRAISVTMPQRQRSAVTNGKRLFVKRPGDTAFARRFRDILARSFPTLAAMMLDCLKDSANSRAAAPLCHSPANAWKARPQQAKQSTLICTAR